MVDAEDHERGAVGRTLAVLARACAGGELVRADGVLGPEVAGAEPVDAAEQPRHLAGFNRRQSRLVLQRLVQRGADVAPHRIVAGHRLVGALEDDDVLLAGQRPHHRRFRERTEHVDVNRAHLRIAPLAQVVHRRLDVLGGRSERHEHRLGILGSVLTDQAVKAAGQVAEIVIRVSEEVEDGLGEVVAARDHALHVVLLVLDRTQEHRVGKIDHPRHAAAGGAEQRTLARRRALDHVVGRAEVFANQLRLVLVERPLEMRGEEPVHHVHARRQTELGDTPEDQRLVGGLLRVLAEDDDPAGIERAVDVVVPAVHVQRVLGERACGDFQHHRRALARRVVILFDAVDNALAGGVIDDALAAHRVRDRPALGGVLAFGFHRDGVAAEDVELPFCIRLLVELAAFGRWRNRIEDAAVCDSGFSVVGN